jgi:hypothetical protein
LQVGCGARGGFDGDVGGDTDEQEDVDPCHPENGVDAVPSNPLAAYPRTTASLSRGGSTSSMTSTAGVPCRRGGTFDERAKQWGVWPDPRQPWLVCDQGVYHLRLGPAEPSRSRAWTPMTPALSARCRKRKDVSTGRTTPLTIWTAKKPFGWDQVCPLYDSSAATTGTTRSRMKSLDYPRFGLLNRTRRHGRKQ